MDLYSILLDRQLSGDDPSIVQSYFGDNLTTITAEMLDGVTSIRRYAFAYLYSLTSLTIPKSVIRIEERFCYNCTSLKSITVLSTTPPTLSSNDGWQFYRLPSGWKFYVPAESVDAYKAATNWSTYASKIQAIPS